MAEWFKYWPIFLFILNFLGLWVGWSVRKGVATQEDLNAHAETTRLELDQHSEETNKLIRTIERRITHVEARIDHGPKDSDLIRLHERLDEVDGELKNLTGQFSGVRDLLQTLHQFLLDEGKRKSP